MAIPAAVTEKILRLRSHLESRIAYLYQAQIDYRLANPAGRYWQGLRKTHGQASPAAATGHPTWEAAGFAAEFPNELGLSIQVNEYQGKHGVGWELVAEIEHAGVTYRTVKNYGPERWRESDWTEVIIGGY